MSKREYPLNFRMTVMGDAEVTNKFRKVGQELKQIGPNAKTSNTSLKETGNVLKSTGQAAQQSTTGFNNYGGALVGLGSKTTQAKTGTDAFIGSLVNLSKQNQAAVGGLTQQNTVTQGLVPTMDKLGTSSDKTGSKLGGLTKFFQGNKGLIFSTTMLGSGAFEAMGMLEGLGDQSKKVAGIQAELNQMQLQGKEGTEEYARAQDELSDAQRGYNFIARFTAQSIGDLIPMSLMFTSSIVDMTSKMGGMSAMKTKLATAATKLTGAISTLGTAMMAFTIRHPILLLLTALAAATIALMTNFMGFRDRVNELGVALGNMLGPAKPILEWLGLVGNQALDTGNSFLNFGQTAHAQLTDVAEQAVLTGDATTLMYTDQIDLINELGEDAENMYVSLGAHVKKAMDQQEEHNRKYDEFVKAIDSGEENVRQSLGLTEEEYKKYFDEWIQEIEDFDQKFNSHVETIKQNYETFNQEARKSQEGLIDDYNKLQEKLAEHYQKREEGEKMDKEARKKWMEDLQTISGQIMDLTGKISDEAFEAAQAWTDFGDTTSEMWDKFKLEVTAGKFNEAIEHIKTAADTVPEKYKGNFEPLMKIISDPYLEAGTKADMVVTDMNQLDPYKSFIVGAHEYTLKQAQVASGLDELAVSARATATSGESMDTAWKKFVATMSEEQRQLPIVKTAIEAVASGHWTAEKAFAAVEAAGRTMSATLGTTVTQSYDELKKNVIVMKDGTKQAFTEINGQVVSLGTVTDEQIISSPKSFKKSMEGATKSAQTELGTNVTKSITDLAKEGKVQFLNIDTAMETTGTAMGTLSTTTETETSSWLTDFENFKTKAVEYLGTVQDTLNTLWQSAKERLGNTTFQNLLPSVGDASGNTEGQQVPVDQGINMALGKGGLPAGMTEEQIKKLHQAWSALSTSVATYTKSMTANVAAFTNTTNTNLTTLTTVVTAFHTAFSKASTSIATYATSMTTNITNFVTNSNTQLTTLQTGLTSTLNVITVFQQKVAELMAIAQAAVMTFVTNSITQLGGLSATIMTTQGAFTTMQVTIAKDAGVIQASIMSMVTNSIQQLTGLQAVSMATHQKFSDLSSNVATYMKSMTNNIKNFASSAVNDLNSVAKAADNAAKAFDKMAEAARKAASAAAKVKGGAGQHGGAFLTAKSGGVFMQTGGFIVDHRQKIGGVTVGEFGKPEQINYDRKSGLMTVTPLTDPNKLHDRGGQGVNGSMPQGSTGGGSGSAIYNITLHINGNDIIDTQKIKKVIRAETGKNWSRHV